MTAPRTRRGGVYPLVLIVSASATAAALTGLAMRKAADDRASLTGDLTAARLIARAAIEASVAQSAERNNWRTDYGNNETHTYSIDPGTATVLITDETDGDLSDDNADPYTLTSVATAGSAKVTLRVTVTPEGSDYRQRVLAAEPIRYWPLDETAGYTADDLTDNQNAGHTNPAALGRTTGFDARPAPVYTNASHYAWSLHQSRLALDEGTVMCWVRCDGNTAGDQVIFAKSWEQGTEGDFKLFLSGDSLTITASLTDDDGDEDELDMGEITPGVWTHIAVSFGDKLCGFVDGVVVDEVPGCATDWTRNNEFINIGAIHPGILTSSRESLNGSVRDVAIFDEAFMEKDVEALIGADGQSQVIDEIAPEAWAWIID